MPGGEKSVTYECGVDPVGDGWAQSHIRYYVFAYLYVCSPSTRSTCSRGRRSSTRPGFGVTTLVEMFVFLGFLGVGLLYAWRKGVLAWR